jgi:enoyl-CoA hydratase/carnithine racemase
MLLLGEPFDARQGLAAGFVNRVLPTADSLPAARAAVDRLCALPAKSVRLTRALLRGTDAEAIVARAKDEGAHFSAMLREPAAREAMAAFMEKRKPDFSQL